MKRFLTLIAVTAALATMAVPAFAQGAGPGGQKPGGGIQGGQRRPGGPGGPGGMGRERMQKMRAELLAKLNLSADQKTKIAALDKKREAEMQKLRQSGDREGMREKMRPIMEKYEKDFNAILTPAQRTKYQELRKEMMEKMRKERGGQGGRPGGQPGGKGGKGGGTPPPSF